MMGDTGSTERERGGLPALMMQGGGGMSRGKMWGGWGVNGENTGEEMVKVVEVGKAGETTGAATG
jgi:hypothetical protein